MRYTWIIPPFEGLAFKKQVRFRVFYSILIVQIDVALLIPKYLVLPTYEPPLIEGSIM